MSDVITRPLEVIDNMKARADADYALLRYVDRLEGQLRQSRVVLKQLRDAVGPAARINRIGCSQPMPVHEVINIQIQRIDVLLGQEARDDSGDE